MTRTLSCLAFASVVVGLSSRAGAAPPGETAPIEEPSDVQVHARARPTPHAKERDQSWFMIGAVGVRSGAQKGARMQLDILGGTHLALGLAGTLVDRGEQVMTYPIPTATGVAYLAYTGKVVGPLYLRAQAGVGYSASASQDTMALAFGTGTHVTSTSKLGEAALFADCELGAHWALVGGPIVQYAETPANGFPARSVVAFVGFSHR